MKASALSAALFLAGVFAPALASAEDLQVNLKDHRGRPMDGQVVATPSGGGAAVKCGTRGGRCTLRVSPGTYSLRGSPLAGGTTPNQQVVIRAGRTATANLAAPAPGSAPAGADAGAPPAPVVVPGGGGGAVRPGGGGGGATAAPGLPLVKGAGAPAPAGVQGGGAIPGATSAPGATPPPTRNLGEGRVTRIRGNTADARGRPVDGTVTVRKGNTIVGTVRTRGGRFVAFDLDAGAYSLSFRSSAGRNGTGNATVRADRETVVNLRTE